MTMIKTCTNWKGEAIAEGVKFVPEKDDLCHQCICQDGFPTACLTVQCSPPLCSGWKKIEGECCEHKCIEVGNDTVINPNFDPADAANLSLRLISSTVTTFLILALLIFTIHRYRQRRILIMRRMLNTEDDNTVAYVAEFNSNDIDMTFPPYEDPPPPYTPPKPPDIDCIEAPPPYQDCHVETNNNSSDAVRNGSITSQCPPYSVSDNRLPQTTEIYSVNETNDSQIRPPHEVNLAALHLDINYGDVNDSACRNETSLNDSNCSALISASHNTQQNKATRLNTDTNNSNNTPCELFAQLETNGHVKSTCGPTDKKTTRSKSKNETPVKRRSKCPHKRNKSVTKSCSFKDGYAQTLPMVGTTKYTNERDSSRMRNSYHASTANSELHDQLPEINWADIETNHIKQASVTKLEMQGNNGNVNLESTELDVLDHLPNVQVDDERENVASNVDIAQNVHSLSQCTENTDESQVSVCSETGEKRKSVGNMATSVSSHTSTEQKESLQQPSPLRGFDNLRTALKADASCPLLKSSNSPLINSEIEKRSPHKRNSKVNSVEINNKINSKSPSPAGTKPKVKRIIYYEPEESNLKENELQVHKNENVPLELRKYNANAEAVYPDNCKKNKTSPVSNEKLLTPTGTKKDRPNRIRDDHSKRRSELFSHKFGKNVDENIMSRSACTAAEYGFDVEQTDDINKAGKFNGIIMNSPTERLRREQIKRKESPETFRRVSMAYDDSNQFKQYGFIDMPNSIENFDNVLREERVRAATEQNKSRSHSREKRSQSQERKQSGLRNNSSDRSKKRHSSYLTPPKSNTRCTGFEESPSPKIRSRSREHSGGRKARKSKHSEDMKEICEQEFKEDTAQQKRSREYTESLLKNNISKLNGVNLIKCDYVNTNDIV